MAAERLLHRRFSEMGTALRPSCNSAKLKYEDIRQSLLDECRVTGHRSLIMQEDGRETLPGLKHLDAFFAGRPLATITTDVLRAFVDKRKRYRGQHWKYPVRNSTINRNLALLRQMMNLARREGKIQFLPRFPILPESPPRKGFVEREKFEKLRKQLPERLRPIVTFLYLTGCRLGEAKGFWCSEVNFDALELRVERERTKDHGPRIIPLDGLDEFVQELKRKQDSSEDGFDDGPVFCATNLRKAWQRACIRFTLGRIEQLPDGRTIYQGLLVQDLRRSAVRNMIDAGVEEKVAMEISGYKRRRVFDPYNAVSANQIHEAIKKVLEKMAAPGRRNEK